ADEIAKSENMVAVHDMYEGVICFNVNRSGIGCHPVPTELASFRVAEVDRFRSAVPEAGRGGTGQFRVHGITVADALQLDAILQLHGVGGVLAADDVLCEHRV